MRLFERQAGNVRRKALTYPYKALTLPTCDQGKTLMQKCILIYEDDLEILQLCRTILAPSGYRIETLSHCDNIVADIEQLHPDAILMDLWIPEIGGEQAIALLKERVGNRDIPVILFSANDEIEAISKRVQAKGFLKKPFDIATLKEMVAFALS